MSQKTRVMDKRGFFRTDTCYKLYLYAKGLAQQVNDKLEQGYIVLSLDGRQYRRIIPFVFEDRYGYPRVAQMELNYTECWICYCHDEKGKIHLYGEHTKKSIRAMFNELVIVHPNNLEKLKL